MNENYPQGTNARINDRFPTDPPGVQHLESKSGISSVGIWAFFSIIGAACCVGMLREGLRYERGPMNAGTVVGILGLLFFGAAAYVFTYKIIRPDKILVNGEGVILATLTKKRFWRWDEIASAEAVSSARGTTTLIRLSLARNQDAGSDHTTLPGNWIMPSRRIVEVINNNCMAIRRAQGFYQSGQSQVNSESGSPPPS